MVWREYTAPGPDEPTEDIATKADPEVLKVLEAARAANRLGEVYDSDAAATGPGIPGPASNSRPEPPPFELVTQKDGLDLIFSQLRTNASRMTESAEELGRRVTAALNRSAAESLVKRKVITEAEKSLLDEQQNILLDQQRQKTEILTDKDQEAETQFFLERGLRKGYMDHLYDTADRIQRGGKVVIKRGVEVGADVGAGANGQDAEGDAGTGDGPNLQPRVMLTAISDVSKVRDKVRQAVGQEQAVEDEITRQLLHATAKQGAKSKSVMIFLRAVEQIDVACLPPGLRLQNLTLVVRVIAPSGGNPAIWKEQLGEGMAQGRQESILEERIFPVRLESDSKTCTIDERIQVKLNMDQLNQNSGGKIKTLPHVFVHILFCDGVPERSRLLGQVCVKCLPQEELSSALEEALGSGKSGVSDQFMISYPVKGVLPHADPAGPTLALGIRTVLAGRFIFIGRDGGAQGYGAGSPHGKSRQVSQATLKERMLAWEASGKEVILADADNGTSIPGGGLDDFVGLDSGRDMQRTQKLAKRNVAFQLDPDAADGDATGQIVGGEMSPDDDSEIDEIIEDLMQNDVARGLPDDEKKRIRAAVRRKFAERLAEHANEREESPSAKSPSNALLYYGEPGSSRDSTEILSERRSQARASRSSGSESRSSALLKSMSAADRDALRGDLRASLHEELKRASVRVTSGPKDSGESRGNTALDKLQANLGEMTMHTQSLMQGASMATNFSSGARSIARKNPNRGPASDLLDPDSDPEEPGKHGGIVWGKKTWGTGWGNDQKEPVGISLPNLPSITHDPGACLESKLPLTATDRLRGSVEKLKTRMQTADSKLGSGANDKSFREAIAELYEELWQLQRKGTLGRPENGQLVLEYAILTAIDPGQSSESELFAAERVGLLLDCLRKFPCCAQLHYWGIEALMHVLKIQRSRDRKIKNRKQDEEASGPADGSARQIRAALRSPTDMTNDNVHTNYQQFSVAVWQYLSLPMRISTNEDLQWKTLEALAFVISPECIITKLGDCLDFCLDLYLGKELRRQEGSAGEEQKANETTMASTLDLRDEHGLLDFVKSKRSKNPIRQATDPYLTTWSLELLLTVVIVTRSSHRLFEQHSYVMRALLRFKFDQKLTLKALLALGSMYELLVNTDEDAKRRLLMLPQNADANAQAGNASTYMEYPKIADAGMLTLLEAINSNTIVPSLQQSANFAKLLAEAGISENALTVLLRGAGLGENGDSGSLQLPNNQPGLMDLLLQVADLAPENRKVSGAALRCVSQLCFLSDAQTRYAVKSGLRTLYFAVRNHPDSHSVLLHTLQIYYAIASHDLKAWNSSLLDFLKTLLSVASLLNDDFEARLYLVSTLRIAAESAEVIDERLEVKRVASALVRLCNEWIFIQKVTTTQTEDDRARAVNGLAPRKELDRANDALTADDGPSETSAAFALRSQVNEARYVIPLLETLAILSHENSIFRQCLVDAAAVGVPLRILEEDHLGLPIQIKAANCIKVLAVGSIGSGLSMHIHRFAGVQTLLRAGRKYVMRSTPLVLELLSAMANLLFSPFLKDQFFGPDKPQLSTNVIEWVLRLMEENAVRDVDVVAQGFRVFGSLTRYEHDELTEDTMIEQFVLNEGNLVRLRLLIKNSPMLQNLDTDPFEFCEQLARQQLAGRPRAGRILSRHGKSLLEENAGPERYWNSGIG